ncbi:hypothetical protein O181_052854 [Austropuccinia psidii MF-1]|uniref:Uncharacterized protein n=1 Tax=Austropuccinia psidii MF-1 TaxID=1389203 RepID=A0A9Q3E1I5_9BASI|nr:hypothetical protein [Austropuccinia psidii MF-1]
MSIPSALAFSTYVDWFSSYGKSSLLAIIGPIILIRLNLPPSEVLKQEDVYVSGLISGPKEPTALQSNYLLMPMIKELKELWQGYHFEPTSMGNSGSFICVAILMAIADVVAMCKLTRVFPFRQPLFVIFSLFTRFKLKKLVPNFTTHAHTQIINETLQNGFRKPQTKVKQFSVSMEWEI